MRSILSFYHGSPGHPGDFDCVASEMLRMGGDQPVVDPISRRGYPWHSARQPQENSLRVGYSWGCVPALLSAADASLPRPSGVVLVSPYLFPRKTPGAVTRVLLCTPGIGRAILKKAGPGSIERMLNDSAYPSDVPRSYRDSVREWMDSSQMPRVLKAATLEKGHAGAEAMRVKMALRTVFEAGIPLAVIWGESDRSGAPAPYENTQIAPLRERCGARGISEFKIPDAGHALLWTHASEVAGLITKFERECFEKSKMSSKGDSDHV